MRYKFQENALKCLQANDLTSFSSLMASVCPVDDNSKDVENNKKRKKEFPLAPTHWINSPYGKDVQFKTLLHLAVEGRKRDFAKVFNNFVLHHFLLEISY